jgi:WD40 repeat protein
MKGNNMTNLMQTLSSQMNMSPSDLLNFNNKNIVSENDMKELQLDINSAKNSMFSKEKKGINFAGINFTEAQRQKYFNLRNLYKTWNKKRFLANRFIDYNRFVVHDGLINTMKVLNDGSLILCTEKGIIIKYDKNVFNEEAVFKNYEGKKIYCANQCSKNNIIFFANENNEIIFIEIVNEVNLKEIKIIKKAHQNVINKIIELINSNLVSISNDGNIKIWENFNERKNIKLKKIYNDVIQINDNLICCLNSKEKKIDFIDFNKGKITNSIENILIDIEENVYDCNLMILLENSNLIVAGNEEFYIINTEKFNIINKIKIEKKITCLLNAFNNCILIGDKGGNIVQYQNENNEYKKLSILKKAHFYFIKSLIFLKNGMIVSLSESTAKIWDY